MSGIVLTVLSHLILPTTLGSGYYYYPHLTVKEEVKLLTQGHRASKYLRLDLNLSLPDSVSIYCTTSCLNKCLLTLEVIGSPTFTENLSIEAG